MELDLCFDNKDGGVSWTETCYRLVFPRGDGYWQVNLAASEENLEQSTLVLVDLLRSLRFEEDSLEPVSYTHLPCLYPSIIMVLERGECHERILWGNLLEN